jgi:hypothetical protein
MKFHLGHLLGLSAIIVAGCAAFFSVFGLSQLFAGASIAVIIMASALEFSKLVAASFLHTYWDKLSTLLKTYLTVGVVVLVTITSAGIYGFLSNAYQKTAFSLEVHDGEIGILDGKVEIFKNKIDNNTKVIDNKNERIKQLSELRTKQEVRLDSMINRRYFSNANATRDEITNANKEIQVLTGEVDNLVIHNSSLNDSISKYQIQKLEMRANSDVAAEVGPLKYMAELMGKPMDDVVNYFILLLIFVFDPLAISLVIATNWVFMNRKKDEVEEDYKINYDGDHMTGELNITEPNYMDDFEVVKESVEDVIEDDGNIFEEMIPTEPEVKEEPKPEPEVKEEVQEEPIIEPEVKEEVKEEPKPAPRKPITLEDIKKSSTNRGFSVDIPKNNSNKVERIGSNKFLEDNRKALYKNRNKR